MLVALGSQQLLRERAASEKAQSDPTLPDADGSSPSADLTAVSDPVDPSPRDQSGAGSPETRLGLKTLSFNTVQVNDRGQIMAEPAKQMQYFDEPYLLDKLDDGLPAPLP